MMKRAIYIPLLILLAAFFTACNHEPDHPGWAYMPDMMYSEPYGAYSENPVFADGKTNQPPVPGTVPRGILPYSYEKSFEGQQKAGRELENPLEVNDTIIAEGKEQYEIFCMSCHGEQGKGDGHLYTAKLFTAKPTSLVDDFVQSKPEGEIYHVITLGSLSGLMGAHGPQINPMDRWKIVHYVKHELPKE